MGTWSDRLLKLKEQHCRKAIELPAEQVALIERANPCFRVGRVCLQPVVDTIGLYAFGSLRTANLPRMETEFCGRKSDPYERYLALNDIEDRRIWVQSPQTNDLVERFDRTVLDGFVRTTFRETFDESVDALQGDLDRWLEFYNTKRPRPGYRNCGRRPIGTIEHCLQKCEA